MQSAWFNEGDDDRRREMVKWPGQGGDEGEEGKYSDVARRKPGRPVGSGATEAQVRDIIRRQGSGRVVDIARQLHEERVGPHVPFTGRDKKNAQHQVSHILKELADRGEAQNQRVSRKESWWRLTPQADDDPGAGLSGGPRGGPKPSGWTGGHARAGEGRPENRRPRGGFGVIREPTRHEPSNPVSAAEQRRRADDRRRRTDRTNPENWGQANTGRTDMAEESDENKRKRDRWNPENWGRKDETPNERDARRRRSDPTNPENWGAAKDKGKSGSSGSLGIFGPATPKDDDGGDDDDNGGGLGIFKGV